MYDYGVFIGRFEPFHNTHLASIKFALERCHQLVIVLGSCNQARNVKNPWTAGERTEMILRSLTEDEWKRVRVIKARDYLYNDNLWITNIQRQVSEAMNSFDNPTLASHVSEPSVALFGHKKDASSFYLKLFPQWKFVETSILSPMNATDIRNRYFHLDKSYEADVPPGVAKLLSYFKTTEEFKRLYDEFHHIEAYKEAWRGAPFPPVFVTVDSVVIKSGHVLVVRRKCNPGKGLIALPGGFLEQGERIEDGALRELKEETGIKKVTPEFLHDSIVDRAVFDHPERSLRGRTITHAFCIDLGHGELPPVKGSDDAEKAWWMPLHEVDARDCEFFEDHYHIVKYFTQRF